MSTVPNSVETVQGISRREFTAGAAVTAGAAALATPVAAFASERPRYTPGTYECQTIGIDLMTVSMTFGEDAIEGATIDANETRTVGGRVVSLLEEQIIANQSADIDIISGASITCKAVRTAARNCVDQALGLAEPLPVDDLISPIEPVPTPDHWDYESDVVIVGASVAGLVCAGKLSQNGVTVTVLEKENQVGGSGRVTTCIGNYGGTKLWEGDAGYFGTPYRDQDVIDYFQERATWSIDPDLLRNNLVSLRETIDWWIDNGASVGSIGGWWASWIASKEGHDGKCTSASISLLSDWMYDLACENGAAFLLSSPASRLVVEDGKVIGVKGEDPEGNTIYAHATTAVVLAADSFQTNPKMLAAYGGLAAGTKSGLAKGCGQVIRMGQGVGAGMAGIGSFAASTSMPIVDGARVMLPMRRNYDGMNYVAGNPWCRFDAKGNRVAFVSVEKTTEIGQCNDSIDCNHRQCNQDYIHGDCFVVMDANWHQNLANNGITGFRTAWNPFDCETCLNDPVRISPSWYCADLEESMEDSIAEGGFKRADTLEDLAELMGVDAGVLTAAVERWNADCEAGEGDAGHGYLPEYMIPISDAPFYGARVTPGLYAAFAGLKVTAQNQVISTEGDPIPGLYAAFHTAGGIAGEQQQLCPMGDQIGSMCASGYNIAKALLGEEWLSI